MTQERDFRQTTNAALDLLQRGQNIASILARFPEDADRLASLLETAQSVMRTPLPQAPTGIEAASKARMMQELHVKKTRFSQHKKEIINGLGAGFQQERGKRLVKAILALAMIFIILSTLSICALAALPGSPLYPAKLALQDVRILLTFNPTMRQARITHYNHLRLLDLEKAVKLKRLTEMEAQATMTAMPTSRPIPTWPFIPFKP